MSKFQIVFIGIFALFIVMGVILFATFKSGSEEALPSITVWGTLPSNDFTRFVSEYNILLAEPLSINYVQKRVETFNTEYVETLARGGGPDAILVPHDLILKEEDKLVPLPYEVFPERTFKDTFIQSAELYLTPRGVLAIPFSIDPLLMYWNRDIFTNAGIPTYPRFWNDFSTLTQRITKKDNAANITQSAVALGEFRNIHHAKDILTTLFLQAGDSIVVQTPNGPSVTFGNLGTERGANTRSAVEFFTSFSNPSLPLYSWNRALPLSKNYFVAGDLATYFGFASELGDIRAKNPNLNFDVAPLPQLAAGQNRVTYGKIHAFALAKSVKDPNATFSILSLLTSKDALKTWGNISGLPPVRRDLLAENPTDPYLAIFYDAALTSRTWVDPDPIATGNIFQSMIESVISSRETLFQAVERAGRELQDLYSVN